jgi:hypothetical protein
VLIVAGLAACGGGGDSKSTEAFCEKARIVDSLDSDLSAISSDVSTDRFQQMLDDYLAAGREAEDVAPSEIKAAVRQMTEASGAIRDIASNNGFDYTKTFDDPDLVALVDDKEFTAVGTKLEAYLADTCGITPDTDATTDTGSAGSGPSGTGASSEDGLAEQLADEFAAGVGVELTPEQRTCVGEGLVNDIGLGTLASAADASDLDSGLVAQIFGILNSCGVDVPNGTS